MKVKIDTKEKFHVIALEEPVLHANMTEELRILLIPYMDLEVKNVIFKMDAVTELSVEAANTLLDIQQAFYEKGSSFVVCGINKDIEKKLDEHELLEVLNTTPTESEAWDIVQMEEIERELF